MANNSRKDDKKRRPAYTTPKAECFFAHIVSPDYGTKDYPDEEGSYNVTLRLTEQEAMKLRSMIASEIETGKQEMQEKFSELPVATRKKIGSPSWNEPGAVEYDRQTEEETGHVLFRFKTKAIFKDRQGAVQNRHVPVFDSMQQPVRLKSEPGNGSIMRVNFSAVPYFVASSGNGGVTFYLNAIQLLKLNSQGTRSASDYGFAAEDDEDAFTVSDLSDVNESDGTDPDSEGMDADDSSIPLDEVPF